MPRSGSSTWRVTSAFLVVALVWVAIGCASGGGAATPTQAPWSTPTLAPWYVTPTPWSTPTLAPWYATPTATEEMTEEPTSEPTLEPTLEPTGPTPGDLMAVCYNTPAAGTAPYNKGRYHPLVIVDNSVSMSPMLDTTYDINSNWLNSTWTSPIQLVLCVGADKTKSAGSCGLYKRASDGKVGSVIKTRHTVTVTVMVASTGKRLQTKVLLGPVPNCDQSESVTSAPPPWPIYGSMVSTAAINNYGIAVARQLS